MEIPWLLKWLNNDRYKIIIEPLSSAAESGTFPEMLRAAQIRAARALLGWGQQQLSKTARVGTATIRRIESNDAVKGNASTLIRIESAFKEAGIIFIDEDDSAGIGVRLVKKKKRS